MESVANSSNALLPNPFTPMAFLPPDLAYQNTITDYVTVGALSVLIWDILTHLPTDYKLLTRHRIKPPTVVYFLSRWSTLLYAISTTVFETAPVDNCVALSKVICAVYHITISSTALLFFLRVRAIFNFEKYITAVFFILWLAVLGGSLTAVMSISGVHIGNTKYCTFSNFKPYRSAANITLAVFDTCVFIAISWRLSDNQLSVKDDEIALKTKFDLLGKYLPTFSRALLQDGQKYYMVAMLANLLVLIMDFIPGVPLPYRAIFLAPAIELTNIMACSVFRRTKNKSDDDNGHAVSAMIFRGSNNISVFIDTQTGGLNAGSVTRGELHGSSTTDTAAPSSDLHAIHILDRLQKETISESSAV